MVNRLIAVAVLALVPMVAAGQVWMGRPPMSEREQAIEDSLAREFAKLWDEGLAVGSTARRDTVWVSDVMSNFQDRDDWYKGRSFRSFLQEYADECYADSVQEVYGSPCPDNLPGCPGFYIGPSPWRHREPTFSGFLQWINRKYPDEGVGVR